MAELHHKYSGEFQSERIAIVGIYPPPFGGVSVHVKRTIKLLENNNKVVVLNSEPRYRFKFFWVYLFKQLFLLLKYLPTVVLYHSSYLPNAPRELRMLCFLKRLLKFRLIVVEHDCTHLATRSKKELTHLQDALKLVEYVVFIGDKTQPHYRKFGICPKKFSVESSFVPPDESEKAAILKNYPSDLFSFLELHKPVVLINAFQLRVVEGKDLYGINFTFCALEKLKKVFPKIGLIVALGQIGDGAYYKKLQHLCVSKNLNKHVYFFVGQKELWPLFSRVDLFVRPTLWDSFGISVAEALFFKIPVVASDVCKRPIGASTFVAGDQNDFVKKVKRCLDLLDKHR